MKTKVLMASALTALLLFTGCKSNTKNELLEVDHVLIWVKDPGLPKSKIKDLGFTAVPDSLSQIHKGQGTTGRYFNFLNTYLELIYVNDSVEFQNNVTLYRRFLHYQHLHPGKQSYQFHQMRYIESNYSMKLQIEFLWLQLDYHL